MKKVISVRFKENGKSYYFDPAGADIKTGEYVIVETARGVECGEVVQGVREIADAAVPKALKPITRMADSVDIRRMRQNREDEKRAYRTCQECIARHGLEMKHVRDLGLHTLRAGTGIHGDHHQIRCADIRQQVGFHLGDRHKAEHQHHDDRNQHRKWFFDTEFFHLILPFLCRTARRNSSSLFGGNGFLTFLLYTQGARFQ